MDEKFKKMYLAIKYSTKKYFQVLNERRKNDASKETIKRLLMEKNDMDRKALREKTMADNPRLGYYKLVRTGDSFKDQWVGLFYFSLLKKLELYTTYRMI